MFFFLFSKTPFPSHRFKEWNEYVIKKSWRQPHCLFSYRLDFCFHGFWLFSCLFSEQTLLAISTASALHCHSLHHCSSSFPCPRDSTMIYQRTPFTWIRPNKSQPLSMSFASEPLPLVFATLHFSVCWMRATVGSPVSKSKCFVANASQARLVILAPALILPGLQSFHLSRLHFLNILCEKGKRTFPWEVVIFKYKNAYKELNLTFFLWFSCCFLKFQKCLTTLPRKRNLDIALQLAFSCFLNACAWQLRGAEA